VVQAADFDLSTEVLKLRKGDPTVGAVVTFVGLVRDMNEGEKIRGLELEHYPGMTEKSIEKIVREARQRWQLNTVAVIHRIGELKPEDQIVFVGVASAHRGEAFAACEYVMDYLKTQAPFWKKEYTNQGARWVDARVSDDEALNRWS
jgi:molybdopterin synthase catalytic subunit